MNKRITRSSKIGYRKDCLRWYIEPCRPRSTQVNEIRRVVEVQCILDTQWSSKIAQHSLTYLDLGPPVPSGTLGDELSPSGTSLATLLASSWVPLPLTPISHISSANVSRHVRFGLPRLFLPPSGVQSNTKLAGLDVGRRIVIVNIVNAP